MRDAVVADVGPTLVRRRLACCGIRIVWPTPRRDG